MQIRHVRDLLNYLHLLESDRGEILTLKRDTLIPVTSFFRDGETFDLMEKNVIPTLIEEAPEHQPIRVWVAGCSTGEEAYTLSILFAEAFDRMKRWPQIKIFATEPARGCTPRRLPTNSRPSGWSGFSSTPAISLW